MNVNLESTAKIETKKRLKIMAKLALINTRALNRFLNLPFKERISGTKRDGTSITLLDYETNKQTLDVYLKAFPQDSFDGEEIHMLRKHAEFTLLEDPVDATTHAITYDSKHPEKRCWATYMLSLLWKGQPVAFALGVPLKREIYWGSIFEGIFLNDKKWVPPNGNEKMTIGPDRKTGDDLLKKMTGYDDLHIAGLGAWLILRGVTKEGICPFHLPHESSCIAAAAASSGAHITNMYGEKFQPYNEQDGLMWKF